MGLTYRSEKGSALTITELDNNFRHLTGSHAITGSQTVSGSITVVGNAVFSGSLTISGSNTLINVGKFENTGSVHISGSIAQSQQFTRGNATVNIDGSTIISLPSGSQTIGARRIHLRPAAVTHLRDSVPSHEFSGTITIVTGKLL